jgi:rhamnogalacturonan endolyase
VPNYVPTAGRNTWKLHVDLPPGAKRPVAVLSQSGVDFQDNVFDTAAYQYWADVDADGYATIPMVKLGTYRLTIYAGGIFGQYVKDGVVVEPGRPRTTHARWREETQGAEAWRIGTPDKSAGEFRHGRAPDEAKPLRPAQHRIYWGAYDFPTDFPNGVRFRVGGGSSEGRDMNYIHWSVFGGRAHRERQEAFVGGGEVNNWTVEFDLEEAQVRRKREGTLTVQLAGAKTAAGNTDVYNASEPHSNLAYTVSVNGRDLEPWIIPYYQSSSCGVRSAVSCYNLAHKFQFDAALLRAGGNELTLSLPFNATNYESALLASSVYVQYDALRLEIA